MSSSDCLVLLVELLDIQDLNIKVQSKLFVLYDCNNQQFLVRGCNDIGEYDAKYSFVVDDHRYKSLIDYIDLFSNEEMIRLTIYNFNDLPLTSEEITYDYLEEYASEEYEFVAYEPQYFSKSGMRKIISTISSLCNYY